VRRDPEYDDDFANDDDDDGRDADEQKSFASSAQVAELADELIVFQGETRHLLTAILAVVGLTALIVVLVSVLRFAPAADAHARECGYVHLRAPRAGSCRCAPKITRAAAHRRAGRPRRHRPEPGAGVERPDPGLQFRAIGLAERDARSVDLVIVSRTMGQSIRRLPCRNAIITLRPSRAQRRLAGWETTTMSTRRRRRCW
jgi:hypothetical protein